MKIIAGNWKLNKGLSETKKYLEEFLFMIKSSPHEFLIFPQALVLQTADQKIRGSKLFLGVQNISTELTGALTGEISASVAAECGARYALVGHSERRQLFHETDEIIQTKFKIAQGAGLIPLLCVGETLDQRKNNQVREVLKRQLDVGLKLLDPNKKFVIAYEPVWAIGTGEVASIEQVKEAHQIILDILPKKAPVLYGGSVNEQNAKSLAQLAVVDGFLIGKASLDPVTLASIAEVCEE